MRYEPYATQDRLIENIKAVLEEKRIRHIEVCTAAGISRKTLYNYLSGADIPLTKADAIANRLGYTLVGLITGGASHERGRD